MIAYLDTSALVKLLVAEPGSDLAREIWNASEVRVTSVIAYAETRAALASAGRDGRLTSGTATAARTQLDRRWRQMYRTVVSDELVRAASDLADREALRGYDAVHLASALDAGAGAELLFVTWDTELARAARRSGASVAPPLA